MANALPATPNQPDDRQSSVPAYTRHAAIVLTAAWLIACAVLYFTFVGTEKEPNWDRALVLYNGLCAVGFTAVGVLLGTQVQEVNVAAARREVQTARKDKDAAQADTAAVRKSAKAALQTSIATNDLGGGEDNGATARAQLEAVRNQLIAIL